jgi:uncharacterized protein (DUF1330 family)
MSKPLHTEPTQMDLEAIAGRQPDGPFVALNLNRYRQRAAYPAGTPDADVSGREAYLRYGIIAFAAIHAVGGRVLWAADAQEVAIGCDHDRYDEVVAVWYPSRAAFRALEHHPGYREAFELHRRASIEQAALLFFAAGAEPRLGTPYGG